MATLAELKAEILDNVQDASFSTGNAVLNAINRGLYDLAETVVLPGLKTSDTVTTSTSVNYVSLPDNFHRFLTRCYSSTNEQDIRIYPTFESLYDAYSDVWENAGNVAGVAIQGVSLYYQYLLDTAETLKIWFTEFPTLLADDDDEPDCLPVTLQTDLLVNYACMKLYGDKVEDGIEGAKVNAAYYSGLYEQAKLKLRNHILSRVSPNHYRKPAVWV